MKTSHAFLKRLEKKRIVSKWPPIWIPFAMTVILLAEAFVFPIEKYKIPMYYAAGFALLYALGHWYVASNLKGKS